MKVKQEKLAELRVTVLESIRDVGNQDSVLEYIIMKYLPKEGAISLSDLIQDEYYDVFEYLFEDEEKNKSDAVREQLQQAWKDVGLADFAILNVRYYSEDEIDDGDTPQEIFHFVANELEILLDEADSKMKEFVERAEEILGFPVKYEFDDVRDKPTGMISHIYGSAK